MLFLIQAWDKADSLSQRLAHLEAHRAHLSAHKQRIRLAGPMLDEAGETPIGSLIVIEAEDAEEARAFLQADPFVAIGQFDTVSIMPFKQVLPAPG